MHTPAELSELMTQVADGDQGAFERLFEATRARLYGVVLRILRDTSLAEEVLQEAYVKIWNDSERYRPEDASVLSWMVAIARTHAVDVERKRGGAPLAQAAGFEAASDTPQPLARHEMSDELKALLECVGQLEPDRQKLILLAYYNGWSREQLAVKFNAPLGDVRTWLRRSLLDIRACLGLA
ncbi:sigma-70 region 2 [Afipia carboxidovorans OM5]|uniref:RNA polymerase, sigma subunit n=1 Tax=Afipia carboxidovorans (strain ATCC 49405 / DSM 1227 / KCTC 32145 / OM5) TaxID=504832 RepID=B6JIH0_AFIC5|nr:sigma-70 family RNA polymerase sigma factor [Afipia carboxidovorans]ACI94214.1 sigma-70 region 2 [Afipia carboxidovorans OM5]AEI02136.1 RNA polymerase, sigma subunit [Afipia carboxidovorans OM4]AEI05712.1 RNA polymerase, sigma subunit [Afipia carboxidovorans OM5]BEV46495.1 sigma-70 family RNA polymerase sigma factor [Afipia carboxidovorans]